MLFFFLPSHDLVGFVMFTKLLQVLWILMHSEKASIASAFLLGQQPFVIVYFYDMRAFTLILRRVLTFIHIEQLKKNFKIFLFGWEQCCNEWCNRYAVLKKGEGNTLSWAMPAGQIGTVHWMSVRESDRDYQRASILSQSLMFLEVDSVARTMLLSCSTESFRFSCSFDHSHLLTLMLHKKTGTRWKTQH